MEPQSVDSELAVDAEDASGPGTAPRPGSRAERARLLSLAFINVLKQRVAELTGVSLVVAGGMLGAALASYFPGDSSWNTIRGSAGAGVPERVHNLLGTPGAYAADMVLQLVGLAGYLAVVALTVWGIRTALLFGMPRSVVRIIQLAIAILLASVALEAAPPVPMAGIFIADSGGSMGRLALEHLYGVGLQNVLPAAAGCGVLALLLFAGALGVPVARTLRVLPALRALGRGASWLLRRPLVLLGRRREEVPVFAESGGQRAPGFGARPGVVSAALPSEGRLTPRAEPTLAEVRPATENDTTAAVVSRPSVPATGRGPQAGLSDLSQGTVYELPPLELLRPLPGSRAAQMTEGEMRGHAGQLTTVFGEFGVRGTIEAFRPGPVVTLYELEPAPGTKSSRVIGLADDIARSMCAVSVRVAVVPGRNVIGVELPNPKRETVWLRELLEADASSRTGARLALVLGKDIGGAPVIADLARMPHLLIAGTTGSGKSVGINTMILSLLFRMPPETCKFIMVDPKMLELSVYDGIPHLLAPVVTDPKRAVVALKWTVREMEDRYRSMSKLGVRNIEGYNARLREAREGGGDLSRRVQVGFDPDTGKPLFEAQSLDLKELPYIVVVVDEMADLMLVAGKDIEAAIQRLAQMARAAGIHLIMATQRPSVDVITGTIKANFPTRISFQVTSKIDSRTILGESGAEQLLGQGDMLYMAGGGRITRVHAPFVSDEEVESVVRCLKAQGEPVYIDAVTEEADDDTDEGRAAAGTAGGSGGGGSGAGAGAGSEDEMYDKAVALVCRERKASTSFVQRYLRVGYNSAARLIERMEQEGVISKANHAGKREVLARPVGGDDDGS